MPYEPLFSMLNHHTARCGIPLETRDQGDEPRVYHGYFENKFGEQWVFTYDYEAKRALLSGGDIGWNQSREVASLRDSVVVLPDGVMLDGQEQAWLDACWRAVHTVDPRRVR